VLIKPMCETLNLESSPGCAYDIFDRNFGSVDSALGVETCPTQFLDLSDLFTVAKSLEVDRSLKYDDLSGETSLTPIFEGLNKPVSATLKPNTLPKLPAKNCTFGRNFCVDDSGKAVETCHHSCMEVRTELPSGRIADEKQRISVSIKSFVDLLYYCCLFITWVVSSFRCNHADRSRRADDLAGESVYANFCCARRNRCRRKHSSRHSVWSTLTVKASFGGNKRMYVGLFRELPLPLSHKTRLKSRLCKRQNGGPIPEGWKSSSDVLKGSVKSCQATSITKLGY